MGMVKGGGSGNRWPGFKSWLCHFISWVSLGKFLKFSAHVFSPVKWREAGSNVYVCERAIYPRRDAV